MQTGTPTARRFRDELYELIDRYRQLPLDDQMNYGDFVQILEFQKFQLMIEAAEAAGMDDDAD